MSRVVLIGLMLMVSGCANYAESITAQMRSLMIGEWCGETKLSDGRVQRWTVDRSSDGTYTIDVALISPNGAVNRWGEYGVWGIRNPIYFTAMRGFIEDGNRTAADHTQSRFYDVYEVKILTDQEFKYKSYTSGHTFTVRKNCENVVNSTIDHRSKNSLKI